MISAVHGSPTAPGGPAQPDRTAQLRASLAVVRNRIATACVAAGRDVTEITLIAVTKTYPVTDVRILLDLGIHDLGESRAGEARDKAAEVLAVDPPARWHFVGQLQTNKARVVATFASAVHSVDRAGLVEALDRAVAGNARGPLDVFVQISLDGDPQRGGVIASGLPALADQVAALETLRLRGVMAVAPQGVAPAEAFARLRAVSADLGAVHPAATAISAGMSDDLEAALTNGATHVRVGSALLGRRPPIVG